MNKNTIGTICATLSFLIWGGLPLFWMQLSDFDASSIIAQRVVWSVVSLLPLLFFRGQILTTIKQLKSPKKLASTLSLAFFLVANWMIYVWGNNNGRIIELALGYYILPLLFIFIGFLFFKEKLSKIQWIAIGLACIGVAIQASRLETIPWCALGVAISFGIYGTLKKKSKQDPMVTLFRETLVMLPFAILYLLWSTPVSNQSHWGDATAWTLFIIALTGLATFSPLLLFSFATRHVPFRTIGILQFIAPTGQFLLGWLYYHEDFSSTQFVSFSFIWASMLTYLMATGMNNKRSRKDPPEEDSSTVTTERFVQTLPRQSSLSFDQ